MIRIYPKKVFRSTGQQNPMYRMRDMFREICMKTQK